MDEKDMQIFSATLAVEGAKKTAELMKEVGSDIIRPTSKSIGNNLGKLADGIFGRLGSWGEKQKIKQQQNLKEFKKTISLSIDQIPDDNLKEPNMYIVGPAIESLKYYFEEDFYKEMFTHLISAACNTTYDEIIHPSFVEIIKQLSPIDALILKDLSSTSHLTGITLRKEGKEFMAIPGDTIFTKGPEKSDFAISNLERLNILSSIHGIDVEHLAFVIDDDEYDPTDKTNIDERFEPTKKYFETLGYKVSSNTIELTTFGKAFLSVCIPTNE